MLKLEALEECNFCRSGQNLLLTEKLGLRRGRPLHKSGKQNRQRKKILQLIFVRNFISKHHKESCLYWRLSGP